MHSDVQSIKKHPNNGTFSFNFNTNYRSEMNLLPINLDYNLLSFDAFKISLGVSLHGGGGNYLTLTFSVQTPKFDN